MVSEKNLVLTKKQLDQRIKRVAYEIYENNLEEKELVLAGVSDNGFILAKMIRKQLSIIAPTKIDIVKISINKEAPFNDAIEINYPEEDLNQRSVILIDDVLNTGKTIAFALKAFLNTNTRKIEVAVMVNRSHKLFPIYPKYTGYELATTFNEHVEVKLDGDRGVYLY